MSTAVEEIISRVNQLSERDRMELMRRFSESLNFEGRSKTNGKNKIAQKSNTDPNIEWIKKNKLKYAGSYVALKDGNLIAYGRTIKEADQAAKAKGISKPFLHYIFPKDYIPFAGW